MSKKIDNLVGVLAAKAKQGSIAKSAAHKQQTSGGDGVVHTSGAQAKVDPDADPAKQAVPASEKPEDSEGKKLEDKVLNPKGIAQPGKNKGGEPTGDGLSTKSASEASSRIANITAGLAGLQKKASAPAAEAKVEAPVAKTEGVEKQANPVVDGVTFNNDMLIKLASTMLSTEEGARIAHDHLEKQAGREAAANLIKSAAEQAESNSASQRYIQEVTSGGAEFIVKVASELDPIVTEEEADFIIKVAGAHSDFQAQNEAFAHPMMKQAYAQGMQDAASLEDAVAEGAEEPSIPGGGAEPTEEDIAMVLEAAVESGEITPEEGEAIIMALIGGGEGGEVAPEGGEVAPEGGEISPEEAAALEAAAAGGAM